MSVIQNKKKPLVVLTGPTAVGKTKLSIALAKAINGEILSADSMQVYKHMDIGSAKIRPEEMEGVPHHLIDILEPWEEFNVVVFRNIVWNVWSRYMTGAISLFWWEAPDFTFRRCFGALIYGKRREHRISKKTGTSGRRTGTGESA